MKPIVKATMIVTIFSICTRGLSFIYRIYLSRMISPVDLGLYQIVLSVFSVLITMTSSGIPLSISKQTALHIKQNNKRAETGTVTAALLVGLIFSIALTALVFILRKPLSFIFLDDRCMALFMLLLPAVIASSMYSAFRGGLWGQRKYVSYSIVEFAEEVFMVIFGIVFLQGVTTLLSPSQSAIMSITVSYVGASILTIIIYFIRGGKLSSPKGYVKPLLKSAIPITGVRLVSTLTITLVAMVLPTILAKYIGTENALSIYGIMMGMTFPLMFMPNALIGSLALVLVPEMSSASKSDQVIRIEKAIQFTLFISILIVPTYIALGNEICLILFKNELAGTYLRFAGLIMIPMGINQICSTMLSSLGHEKQIFYNSILSGIIILICVLSLSFLISIYSLIVGFFVAFSTTSVLNIISLKKKTDMSLKFIKSLIMYLLLMIPCIFLTISTNKLLNNFMPLIFSTGISALVCVASTFLLMLVFQNDIIFFKQ